MTREAIIFARLCQKYVQRGDRRQRDMGLQYTEAETHDLASFIDDLFDDLDESCKHGFADWRNCGTCTLREKLYAALAPAQGMSAEGENSRSEVEGEARQPGPAQQDAPE